MRELAIDFGTSNTVAAVRTAPGAAPQLLQVDGLPTLSSAVFLAKNGTELIAGREAERQSRLDPARYEPNPKRRIDDVEVLLGPTVIPVVDLIAAVLRKVATETTRQLGGPPDRVVLTHPADWRRIRQNTLLAAARAAGWGGRIQLLAEPVSAAAHFANLDEGGAVQPGTAIAIYDMGGGTTDTAVVLRTEEGWQVLAEDGLSDVGGRDIDQLLLDRVRQSVGADRPEWAELLRPSTPVARRAARAMLDDIAAGKEALSSYPQTDIPLPHGMPDVHLTRAELEELVRPSVERATALLASTIATTGLPLSALAGIYLVGGASRMPLVGQLIAERTGIVPVAVQAPESSVALGALNAPVGRDDTDPREPPACLAAAASTPEPATAWQHPGQHATQPMTQPQPVATPQWTNQPKRKRWPWVAAAAGAAVLAAGILVPVLLSGDDPTANGQRGIAERTSTNEPEPAPPDPNNPLDSDPQVRSFAGDARAVVQDCTDKKGSAADVLEARTQVECWLPQEQGEPYAVTYYAGDDSCGQLLRMVSQLGAKPEGTGDWSSGEHGGRWMNLATSIGPSSAVTYWATEDQTLCGLVEPPTGTDASTQDVHDVWESSVKQGN
ncbi:Hsp70 protein [Tamaricihabitans halophyticus]|uniref:Hsp70 protein n=1 Tax=Tamaricihabitans halophyticus TaxID=1262583 RepID=A0A4R2RD75_9PSEU|nr:Hsp70 family protein [Tamaricihabitans halophyticus]TCP57365.1 Hsp70 protein [Tamaricihabitans halophyticus]